MRFQPISILMLFAFLFSWTSCSSDGNDDPVNPASGTPILSFKVNGVTWAATKNISAAIAFVSSTRETDGVIIMGRNDDNHQFQITTAREVNGPGTYAVPSSSGGGLTFQYDGKTFVANALTVVITEIKKIGTSDKVIGTFEGTANNLHDSSETLSITEGVFDGAGK